MAGLRRFRYRTAWPCDDNPAIGGGPPGVAGAMRGDRVHRRSGGRLAFVLRGRPVAPGRPGRGLGLGGGGNGLPPAALACPALRLPGQCRLRGPRAQLPGVRAAQPARSRVQLAGDRHVRPAPRPRVVRARRGLRAAGARRAGGVLGRRRAFTSMAGGRSPVAPPKPTPPSPKPTGPPASSTSSCPGTSNVASTSAVLHDTVLNTLTALARAGPGDAAGVGAGAGGTWP